MNKPPCLITTYLFLIVCMLAFIVGKVAAMGG